MGDGPHPNWGLLAGFEPGSCAAVPADTRDGRTFDFAQRDAPNYHLAAVQPLVEMALYAPGLVDRRARAAIASGLEFLRPFFLGEREHVEFERTTVAFDVARRDDGNPVFRTRHGTRAAAGTPAAGEGGVPQVRGWTEQIVDAAYDPRVKLLAAIHGEPQRRSQWGHDGSASAVCVTGGQVLHSHSPPTTRAG